MESNRIYVDFDDVLCQTAEAISDLARRKFGKHVRFRDIHSFNIAHSFDLTSVEVEKLMSTLHTPELLTALEPMPAALDVLRTWADHDREIVVVTGRPPSSRPASEQWLADRSVPYVDLIFVDKYSRAENDTTDDYCLSVPELFKLEFGLAIDDSVEMSRLLAANTSIPTVLFDRPWNRSLPTGRDAGNRIERLGSWQEIAHRFPCS